MKLLTVTVAVLLAVTAQAADLGAEVLCEIQSYEHVREVRPPNGNRSPEIDKFLAWAGLGPGYAWCQAFPNYCWDTVLQRHGYKRLPACASVAKMAHWAAGSPLRANFMDAEQIVLGGRVPPGAVLAFKHGLGSELEDFDGPGHAATSKSWFKKGGSTWEGNTKPGTAGDQRGAVIGDTTGGYDGVYMRQRSAGLGTKFPLIGAWWPKGVPK